MAMSANEKRFREDLPDALVLLRKARGWTQGELAQRMGASQPILCRFETGNRTPTSASLSEHLHALQANWADLNAALEEVRRAKRKNVEPAHEALTLGEDNSQEDLLVAYLAAAEEGRGEEFVNQAVEQARYLARLRERLQRRRGDEGEAGDEPSASEEEPAAAVGGSASWRERTFPRPIPDT